MADNILEVSHLVKHFPVTKGGFLRTTKEPCVLSMM